MGERCARIPESDRRTVLSLLRFEFFTPVGRLRRVEDETVRPRLRSMPPASDHLREQIGVVVDLMSHLTTDIE